MHSAKQLIYKDQENMFKTESPNVQKIANVVESHGCTINGNLISLDSLAELYQNLSDAEKGEISSLVQSLQNEREEAQADIDYANNEIETLDPDLEDELEEQRSDLQFAQNSVALLNPAIERLEEIIGCN
jgi:uncharacterized membrane protein YgaE (UPF0421/DUF939 family)